MTSYAFEMHFNMLYSIYAFINILAPYFTGILRDNIGDKFMIVFLSYLTSIGSYIFYLGL